MRQCGCLKFELGSVLAVIFPTVWLYLQDRFGAEEYWLGLLISAYAFAGLFFSPLFGRIADVTQSTRNVVLIGNLFMIVGSFMYSLAIAPWFLLISRFVAGKTHGKTSELVACPIIPLFPIRPTRVQK